MLNRKTPARPAFVYSNKYEVDIGDHVFPTEKYRLVKDLLVKGKHIQSKELHSPKPVTREQLLLAHTPEYLHDFLHQKWTYRTLQSELPLNDEIIKSAVLAAGGTILAGQLALERGIGIHIGGGFHHAFADRAEGFCYINDIAVGIRVLQKQKKVRKAFVIDLDLHQGNGTAHIFKDDPTVFTFSIHQENNYPKKEKSNLDIGLEDSSGDDVYLRELKNVIPKEMDKFKTDLVVYVAGADPFKEDQLGDLKLTKEGLIERDRRVIQSCVKRKIPLVIVFAGGYAKNTRDTVEIHANTCLAAIDILGKNKKNDLRQKVKPL